MECPYPTELAWAGGLFEGEGCITRRMKRYPSLQLRMKDEDIVRKFASIVGGRVYKENNHDGHGMVMWFWTAGGAEASLNIYHLLLPWLGERRRARGLEIFTSYAPHRTRKRTARERGVRG